jgi:hypothetical protein
MQKATELTIGQHLQNWLIKNRINVTDAIFPGSVDLAVENAKRSQQSSDTKRSDMDRFSSTSDVVEA